MSTTPTPRMQKAWDDSFTAPIQGAAATARACFVEGQKLERELQQATAERDAGAGKATPEHTWKQWTAELHADLARVTAELELQTTIAIGRGELVTQAEACITDREEQLARVTAEREEWKVCAEEMDGYKADCMTLWRELADEVAEVDKWGKLCGQVQEERNTIRARVAELEFDAEFQKQYAEAGDVKLAQERATVAEVVPALRNCMDMLEELDGLNWGDDGMPFTIAWDHLNPILKRAESATPAKHPDTVRPRIVCLCGSTRFKDCFESTNEAETLAGKVVLPPGCFSRSTPEEAARGIFKGCTEQQKVALDALHKRKIDMADEVLVLNVNGYVGESTRSEIEYARSAGKPVRWLECDAAMKGGAHD